MKPSVGTALLVPCLLFLLSPGCSNQEPTAESRPVPKAKVVDVEGRPGFLPDRFSVTSYGSFRAGGDSYSDHQREILVVKDNETGVEYLTITGCGTSELVKKGKSTSEE